MGKQSTRGFRWGLVMVPLALCAQERPLSVLGTLSTGYYNTNTSGEANQKLQFVPLGLRFDIQGYLISPDLLNFSVQPELNAGPQASEAGFQGGNGVHLQLTFLRRILPITFRYSNVQVEDVYFGGLSQVSGYTLKDRNKDLGLTVELKPRHLPETIIDAGTGSVNSKPGIAGIPDYLSNGNHANVDSQYDRWGWVLGGFLHYQYQQSDLLAPADGSAQYGSLQQTVLQYQGSARRAFLRDSEFSVEGGSQSTSSLLLSFPIDLTTRYANANLRLFQRRRWRTTLRAGYSSNIASQLLAQAASSLTGTGSIAPDGYVLAPFSHGIANYNVSGTTNVTLSHGFGLYATGERSSLFSDNTNSALGASYTTGSAGVTYAQRFHWGGISGEYGRELGKGSVTGQSGTIQGQTYHATYQYGGTGRWHFDASVHGLNQSVHNVQPLKHESVSTEGAVAGRIAGEFSARIGGGWQWSSIVNGGDDFLTNGYLAQFGIEHPRFQVDASFNDALSNSLPIYNPLVQSLGPDGILLASLHIIPSDYRAAVVTMHATPLRKIEISGQWTHSRQHLDGVISNDFSLLNFYLTYHFRKIQVEAGLIRSTQIFALYPLTVRDRFYVRIVRTARLL